jgi:hypothetical protein
VEGEGREDKGGQREGGEGRKGKEEGGEGDTGGEGRDWAPPMFDTDRRPWPFVTCRPRLVDSGTLLQLVV